MSLRFTISALILLFATMACNSYHKALRKHNNLTSREKLMITSFFIEATRYRILEDADNAVNLYDRVLAQDPLHDGSLFELARLKALTGDLDVAAEMMKTAMKIDPENIWYHLGYATILEKSGKFSEAATQYRILETKYTDKYELYEYEAQCYLQDNEYQKAIDVYNKLELLAGINEESSIQKYYIYQNWGKVDKAMNEIQKLADKFPENSEYSIALAGYFMRIGKAGLALSSINVVLAIDPGNALAHTYLADYYHLSGNDSLAVKEISYIIASRSIGVDEKIMLFMNVLSSGSVYGDTTTVYPLLDTLIAVHPSEAKSYAMYADFLNADDRVEEAVNMWKKALQFDNSRFQIWEMIMNELYDKQQYDTLLEYSSRSAELFPEQSGVWFFLGSAQFYTGQYYKAITSLEMSLDLRLSKREIKNKAMFLLAESYLKINQPEKSDEAFDKLIAADESNLVAMNAYAYSLVLRGEKIEKAQELIDKALPENTDKLEFQHTHGLMLFRQKKYTEAVGVFRNAMQLGGEKDGALLEHYADVLYFLGEINEALRYWMMAREMGGAGLLIDKKIADKKYYE